MRQCRPHFFPGFVFQFLSTQNTNKTLHIHCQQHFFRFQYLDYIKAYFTARDMVSRWDVLQASQRATANSAKGFLETVQQRLPFPLKAVQVDGGSEYMAEFEQACQEKNIRLFVLPPRSPKLNGCVERAHRTHVEEFYQVYADDWELPVMNQVLQEWERIYNQVRPHHSLDNLTPQEYIQSNYPQFAPQLSHMY
ncbi:MAG: integrase core domain-containing protein [Pelolinea sp.]|nr:integrase core domain-containing protein [Pelolinea sp.]